MLDSDKRVFKCGRLSGIVSHVGLCGLGFEFAWRYWFMGSLESLNVSFMAWCPRPLTGVKGLFILALGALLLVLAKDVLTGRMRVVGDVSAVVLMVGSSIVVTQPVGQSVWGAMGALLCAGMGSAWLYLRWAERYCSMTTPEVFVAVFGACVLGTVLKLPLYMLSSSLATIAAVVCGVCSFGCLGLVRTNLAGMPGRAISRPVGWPCIARLSVATVAFNILEAIVPTILDVGISGFSFEYFLIEECTALALSGTAVAWALAKREACNIGDVWPVALVLTGALLLLVTFGPHPVICNAIMHGAFTVMWAYLWVAVIEISRFTKMSRLAFIGILGGLSWIPYPLCSAAIRVSGCAELGPIVSFSTFFILVVIILFCTNLRNPDMRIVLTPIGSQAWYPEDYRTIDDKCAGVGAMYGLTKREIEVMAYVGKGRSRAYIAEKLFVSESTVKVHIKHIYAKLGIKNKQELMSVLEVK